MLKKLLNKIRRKYIKLRFRPISVFVFHHVSKVRNPLICQPEDWTQLDQFMRNIERLSERYTFISLREACSKLQNDKFRLKDYAVLTTDDGLSSILNVIPWLEERKIPLTLFINSRYMQGNILKPVHLKWLLKQTPDADVPYIAQQMYLSKQQIWTLNSPYIEIGLHGHEHLNAKEISETAFEKEISLCAEVLHTHPRYLAAYAYPWGSATEQSLSYLLKNSIIPVLVDNQTNYKWSSCIHRECIDNKSVD